MVASVAAMVAGLAVIYACGVLWLAFLARTSGQPAPIGVSAALATGLYPFVIPDLIKVLAAGGVMPALWRLFGSRP